VLFFLMEHEFPVLRVTQVSFNMTQVGVQKAQRPAMLAFAIAERITERGPEPLPEPVPPLPS
jgi:hypothetical protein